MSVSPSQFLRIGSFLCDIDANPWRYAEMLAHAYGAPLFAEPPGDEAVESVEWVLQIREQPRSTHLCGDRLVVTPTKQGYRIETDPLTCELVRKGQQTHLHMFIHQPQMDSEPLKFHLWLVTNRILLLLDALLLHTAAIEINGNLNLFCGHKGAGKSTLSVFLGQNGANILAEDHVILRRRQQAFYASGCTLRMRVTAATEQHLLADQLTQAIMLDGDSPKKEFLADQFFQAMPHLERSPRRLFLNRVGQSFSVKRLSSQKALLQMLDTTGNMMRFTDQKDHDAFLGFLASFVGRVDCYSLELSPDLSQLSSVLDMLNEMDAGESAK